tara:strand:+ start:92 stop:604 length:513 start_codon:yes stop_codon:yes gene_type:complete
LSEEIVNKVAKKGLVTLEMKSFKGNQERATIDISQWLFEGLILREKIFRSNLKTHNWEQYNSKYVAIYCSVDTIIPVWAYMLVVNYLNPYAKKSILGDQFSLEKEIFEININQMNAEHYTDKRILIKGCSDTFIPEESFVLISEKLMGFAKSIMFGEACSNVPIFKKRKI